MASADGVLGSTPVAALSWNPAGLASTDTPEFDVALATLQARGKFTNRVDSTGLLSDASGIVPDGAVAFPLRQRHFVVAGGLLTDGALAGSWNFHDPPGAAGASCGLVTHQSGVVVLRPTAAVAVRVNPRFSVGGSVSMAWNRNELNAPYIFQTQAPLVGLKTLLDVHASGIGWMVASASPSGAASASVSRRVAMRRVASPATVSIASRRVATARLRLRRPRRDGRRRTGDRTGGSDKRADAG